MRDAIQSRVIRRGTDWDYLSEVDRRALSATALEAGDDCWLDYADELRQSIIAVLNGGDVHTTAYALSDVAITIAHHSGKYLYEDTWPRMDSEEFTG